MPSRLVSLNHSYGGEAVQVLECQLKVRVGVAVARLKVIFADHPRGLHVVGAVAMGRIKEHTMASEGWRGVPPLYPLLP